MFTGWDAPQRLALAADALTLESHTNIPAEGLYAMARSGLPSTRKAGQCLGPPRSPAPLRQAAEGGNHGSTAIAGTFIPPGFAADFRFNNSLTGAVSAPKDFIAKARVAENRSNCVR